MLSHRDRLLRAPTRIGGSTPSSALRPTAPVDGLLPAAALLVVLAVITTGGGPALVPALYVAAATPLLTVIDVAERRLPHGIVLPGYGAAALGVVGALVGGFPGEVALACGLAGFLGFAVLVVAGGMGMGDATLAGLLGVTAGLLSPGAALGALVVAVLLGGIAAVLAAAHRRDSLPFGPYLLAGFWISLVATHASTVNTT